ncbi:MAG: ADP-ribose pyrophosphatase [Ignavibacteria bacterium]|nr:ADP-ribose pyrophosphatase [Ignavibacteria bacterium]
MTEEKFWKVTGTKKGFAGKWIDINLDEIELPDKSKIEFEAIGFHRNGAGVAAENDKGEIILVKNYRYINNYLSWEVPAGTIPPGVKPDECIIEELKEEAGCEVGHSDLKYLGNYYPSVGSSNQIFYCFHARNVRKITDEIDANEIMETSWFNRNEIEKMIRNCEIKDGFSLYLLLRWLYLL